MPLAFDAAILSRMRSPAISRSNWANESSMLRVRRPIEVVVLNCCVTETNEASWASSTSTIFAKSASDRVRRSTLVNDNDLNLARLDIGEEPLQGGALYRAAGEASVVVHVGKRDPSGMTLPRDVGLTGFALRIERVELLLEPIVGRLACVDRAVEHQAGLRAIRLPHVRPPRCRRSGLRGSSNRRNGDPTNGPQ